MYELLILGWFSALYELIPSCPFINFQTFLSPHKSETLKFTIKSFNFCFQFLCIFVYHIILQNCVKLFLMMFPKKDLEPCTFIRIQVIFPPVRLFHPVRLLIFGKCSTLYVYSILYDYLVLKSSDDRVLDVDSHTYASKLFLVESAD